MNKPINKQIIVIKLIVIIVLQVYESLAARFRKKISKNRSQRRHKNDPIMTRASVKISAFHYVCARARKRSREKVKQADRRFPRYRSVNNDRCNGVEAQSLRSPLLVPFLRAFSGLQR